jgi:hypothetical protein
LHALFVCITICVVCCDSTLIFIEFGIKLGHLTGRKSQVLLCISNFFV